MKFRLHEKLKYMLFGGLLVLTGSMFGNMSSNTAAQFGSETIDELIVRKLKVTEDITLYDGFSPLVHIHHNEHGGQVIIASRDKSGFAQMGITENGGKIVTISKESGGVIISSTEDMDGIIEVYAKGHKKVVKISNNAGGYVSTLAKTGEGTVVLAMVKGDGVVVTQDKFGRINAFPIE